MSAAADRDQNLPLAGPGRSFRCDSCQNVVRVVGNPDILTCPYCGAVHDTRRDPA